MAYQPEPQPPWPDNSDGTDEALVIGGSAGEVLGLCDANPVVDRLQKQLIIDQLRDNRGHVRLAIPVTGSARPVPSHAP